MGIFNLFGAKAQLDTSKIYPYLITNHYLEKIDKKNTLILDTLLEGSVYLTLVKDLSGKVENINPSELKEAKISERKALELALVNLDLAFKNQEIKVTLMDGPDGISFMLFSDHWLAATSIFWSKLFSFTSENLQSTDFYLMIPQREVMIILPKCSEKTLGEMKRVVMEKESGARKPLTLEVYEFDEQGIRKIK